MGHYEHAALNLADGLPALFVFDIAVLPMKGEGIEEYLFGSFEGDAVFVPIDAVFGFVPFDMYPRICIITCIYSRFSSLLTLTSQHI